MSTRSGLSSKPLMVDQLTSHTMFVVIDRTIHLVHVNQYFIDIRDLYNYPPGTVSDNTKRICCSTNIGTQAVLATKTETTSVFRLLLACASGGHYQLFEVGVQNSLTQSIICDKVL